jgi:hypothetical protein
MEENLVYILLYILSVLIIVSSGSKRIDAVCCALASIGLLVIGLAMFNTVELFGFVEFLVFTVIVFCIGLVKGIYAWI